MQGSALPSNPVVLTLDDDDDERMKDEGCVESTDSLSSSALGRCFCQSQLLGPTVRPDAMMIAATLEIPLKLVVSA